MALTRFFAGLFAPPREEASADAERPLRLLLVASIVLPVVLFLGAALISYRSYMTEAEDRLQRNLGTVYEHALKVFETFEITERYLDELFAGVTDGQIRAAEEKYNTRLRGFTETMPQLADIWVVGADGHPVVSGTVFPMPRDLDLADRDYFRVHKNNEIEGVYVSDIVQARATNSRGRPRFFSLTRKRVGPDGAFAGVITISIAPEYFAEYYATLQQPLVATIIRQDGYVLARYPPVSESADRLGAGGPFMQALRAQRQSGTIRVRSSLDGVERDFAYRKLPRLPIYIAAGVDLPDVRATWLIAMSRHLIFGIPATFAMFTLTLLALRHTRRGAAVHRELLREVARREETEQKLRQSQKMDAIGRLTGGIAHDFNNLLTAIIGNLDLSLRRLEGQDRVRAWLGNCRQAADRAATLVQRMLAFSRQHPLEVKAVDINRLVQGMSELLRSTIGETITVETVLAGGLWKTAVDPNQLENAILNLAVNARDAMPDGGRLTIETANGHLDERYAEAAVEDVRPGQYVMVAVTDNGTGMTREVISRAFDPFFTTKPAGAGTGLGLSMVYGFAKQSGGHVGIYSEIGEGTTIKLYFPRLAEQGSVPSWIVRQTDAATPAPDGTETILVVEDDAQVNRFAVEALEERGYRVLAAPDGPTALRLLEHASDVRIDLLLTDVVLPAGMNGRQLADAVLARRPGVKVLYITGYTRNAIIHHGRLDPDIALLTKPFTADALARKLRRILDGST
jgi:two-component system NtrC family sensor kinase